MAKSDRAVEEESLAIGAPVSEDVTHPLEPCFVHGLAGVELDDSCNAAHF